MRAMKERIKVELLWTYEQSGQFSSETASLSLIVTPANIPDIFRYLVLKQMSDALLYASVASGHKPTLREAMIAAEISAGQLETIH